MSAHTQDCDGWFYVGKDSGRTVDPEDDSIYCSGQCHTPELDPEDEVD